MTGLLWMVGVFAAAGLAVWGACRFDDWVKSRDSHRTCRLCHPDLWEPPSRLDRADGVGGDPWQP